MIKYGIFGLTGDPCTYAHYEIVRKALKSGIVDKVIVIPTIVDYYRKDKAPMFTYAQRLAILKKWFGNKPNVIVDDFEYGLHDKGERRYWHMLQDIKIRYSPETSSAGNTPEFYTIVGSDSWNNITNWYNFEKLGTETKFIVVMRNRKNMKPHVNFYINYPEYRHQPYDTIKIGDECSEISASEIRKRLSQYNEDERLDVYLREIEDYLVSKEDEWSYDSEELLVSTPIFDVVRCAEVEEGFRPIRVKSPDWVAIAVEKDGKFTMVRQLRYGLNKEFEEFPCGVIESGEDVIDAGIRELKEETGIKILDRRSVHYLGKFATNPGCMANYMHYLHVNLDYAAFDITEPSFDEHEHLISYEVEKNEAFSNFMKSEGSALMGNAWMLLLKNKRISIGE